MLSYKFFKEKATLNVLPWSNQKQNEVNLVLEKLRKRVVEGTTLLQLLDMGRNPSSGEYLHAMVLRSRLMSENV